MKNQKGISLIALIITIIVIIILAVVVIAGANNTPEQAQFATFCQDYDTIQSAITTTYAKDLVDNQLATTGRLTTAQLYYKIAKGSAPNAETTPAATEAMTAEGFAHIGVSVPTYSTAAGWSVNTANGQLTYTTGFPYNGKSYTTPSTSTAAGE